MATPYAAPLYGAPRQSCSLTFLLDDTWEVALTPHDTSGNAVDPTGITAWLRVVNVLTREIELQVQGAVSSGNFVFTVPPSAQDDFDPYTSYQFQIQMDVPDATLVTQQYGQFYVNPSLFGFPFPIGPTSYQLDFRVPTNFSFNAAIGVL